MLPKGMTTMRRRDFVQAGILACAASIVRGAEPESGLDEAAKILREATASGQIAAATLYVRRGAERHSRAFGQAKDEHAMFLLGSISKPIAVTALMTLHDRGEFRLDDPVRKFLPNFTGEGREQTTMQQLLTHVSGLPDQLPENDQLRRQHATLEQFADRAQRTPLHFAPGTKYQYSSMAILLAARVAELISGASILQLVERSVFAPLGMKRSAQGLGRFQLSDMVLSQTDRAAPEAGGGDPQAKDWDWNSPYWRKLGAPWGGTHCSAADVGRFLAEFLDESGRAVKPETARRMKSNQNPVGLTPRGLGLNVGAAAGSPGCSDDTFGHTGSTGTIAWADPRTKTICVVLTSLPARAVTPHPRDLAAAAISKMS